MIKVWTLILFLSVNGTDYSTVTINDFPTAEECKTVALEVIEQYEESAYMCISRSVALGPRI